MLFCFFRFKELFLLLCKYSDPKYYWCPQKCQIIFGTLSKWLNFQYCDSNIGFFSIASCKASTPFSPLTFGISTLLLFLITLHKVIALQTISMEIVVALSRF